MIHQDLVPSLQQALAPFGYVEPLAAISVEGIEGILLATQRKATVRYLCGVFELPDTFEVSQARKFIDATRREISKRYAKFPYWKELGTYLVWICDKKQLQHLEKAASEFKDRTGFHVNVMLGAVLAGANGQSVRSERTWGLFESGAHFGAIEKTVRAWSEKRESAAGDA
ncbi:hypothetical protein C7S18_06230 [Ahniella affigens]|uniref:Uncharacterized protein n=1 Tax=Ahniella affigens TaxID=2021234 RepID=A0A2P1PPR1_9GAMM|nr:hypothetical protein [Ahniella affigens]AVP96823.1 hypothetical protein C7S18_06230 [Ahniella affigens]